MHWLTLEALNAVQLSQQLIDHAVCDPSVVMATRRRDGIKLVKEQHARSCSLGTPKLQQISPLSSGCVCLKEGASIGNSWGYQSQVFRQAGGM